MQQNLNHSGRNVHLALKQGSTNFSVKRQIVNVFYRPHGAGCLSSALRHSTIAAVDKISTSECNCNPIKQLTTKAAGRIRPIHCLQWWDLKFRMYIRTPCGAGRTRGPAHPCRIRISRREPGNWQCMRSTCGLEAAVWFEKHHGMQRVSSELGWPLCPRCGPALPASCGSKNALTVLSFVGLSGRRADAETAMFCFQPKDAENNSALVKTTQNSGYEFKRKFPT